MDIREPECPVLPLKTQTYAKCSVSSSESLTRLKVAAPGTYSQVQTWRRFVVVCAYLCPVTAPS